VSVAVRLFGRLTGLAVIPLCVVLAAGAGARTVLPLSDADPGTVDPGVVTPDDPALEPAGPRRVAVFSGLDKITARVTEIEATIGEPVRFGTLQIVVRTCNQRPPEEPPETTAFVEVVDVGLREGEPETLFTGWMFASSPALNALEHPVYDVWLTNCKTVEGAASSGSE